MTEDEAKTKWCPFTTVSVGGHYTVSNRGPNDDRSVEHYKCIASACMAWRWESNEAATQRGLTARLRHGGCGLAGSLP